METNEADGFDVIQLPKRVDLSQLPEQMEVDRPFMIGDDEYVLVLSHQPGLRVCKESSDDQSVTTVPGDCKNFYILKRLST